MEIKVCPRCGEEFEKTRKKQPWCPPCKRQYDREYHANRTSEVKLRKLEKQNERKQEGRQFIWDYLKSHSCEICGESDPVVLEFDHLDRETKLGNVCEMYRWSIRKIEQEIIKCRVLCANCHRRHTAVQMGWHKGLI